MKNYQVGVISGRNLRFYVLSVLAADEEEAKEKTLDIVGREFDNQITSVWEV